MKSTRLEFVQGAVGVGVASLLTAACGGDDDDKPADACGTTIGTNHGHEMTVTKTEAMAGNDKTYDIKGTATHSHTVELSADAFADLLAGTVVSVTSSTDAGHSHEVTVDCS